jgi:hypothetical protein
MGIVRQSDAVSVPTIHAPKQKAVPVAVPAVAG